MGGEWWWSFLFAAFLLVWHNMGRRSFGEPQPRPTADSVAVVSSCFLPCAKHMPTLTAGKALRLLLLVLAARWAAARWPWCCLGGGLLRSTHTRLIWRARVMIRSICRALPPPHPRSPRPPTHPPHTCHSHLLSIPFLPVDTLAVPATTATHPQDSKGPSHHLA